MGWLSSFVQSLVRQGRFFGGLFIQNKNRRILPRTRRRQFHKLPKRFNSREHGGVGGADALPAYLIVVLDA